MKPKSVNNSSVCFNVTPSTNCCSHLITKVLPKYNRCEVLGNPQLTGVQEL